MAGLALLILVLLPADASDEEFLLRRLDELAKRYEESAGRQSPDAIRVRAAVVRELAHLPFEGEARQRAGRLLGRIIADDPAYGVRAQAARAIGRVGTARALETLFRTLFGEKGRNRRYAMLYEVLPEALGNLDHADDLAWISDEVLAPARQRRSAPILAQAGPLRQDLVGLTLEGMGRARARILLPDVIALAEPGRDPVVRRAALGALVRMDAGGEQIRAALDAPDELSRAAAAAYPRLAEEEARRALQDPSTVVRLFAIRGLVERPPPEGVALMVERLSAEQDDLVQIALADALHDLTGKEFGTDPELWAGWWEANRSRFRERGDLESGGRAYFFEVGLRTRRVVFLIDVSASMSREDERRISRLEQAARELENAVSRLAPEVRFQVLAFASSVSHFPDRTRTGDRGDAQAAAAWLRAKKPTGATNTYGVLMEALEGRFVPDTIVLLSDGNPYRCSYKGKTWSEHEQILAEVRRANELRRIRIHTVALLNGVPTANEREDADSAAEFLRRIAEQNRGEFREIR